ncbi:SDR family NAD(P)-dependent oxidoreductase [bacterium]|nr:SDR family NAD(P)-dependent oxidoreductase [bacterium]
MKTGKKEQGTWLGLEGKTAIVTGGASGIGRAVCEELAAAGAHVVVADVNEGGAQQLARDLQTRFGGMHLHAAANVASKPGVDALIKAAVDAFGSVDILVNNAGINIPRLLVDPAGREELTEEIWDKVVAINQKGMFLCAQAAARAMLKSGRGGVIINMASESGTEGSEGQSVYAATKAAAYALTRSWAKELGRHKIRIVGVAPGILEATALRSDEYERALAYTRGITVEKLREGYQKVSIPLGRSGRLGEVANLVAFLASDRASYIHGTTVNISGGKSRT